MSKSPHVVHENTCEITLRWSNKCDCGADKRAKRYGVEVIDYWADKEMPPLFKGEKWLALEQEHTGQGESK